jgi:Fe-S-cluster containining protein
MKLFNFLNRPKFIRRGNCKKCGNCCRNIVFYIQENIITTEEQFDKLKKWKKIYNHFCISGKDNDGALLFTCKSLNEDNICKNYKFRSLYCRTYPKLDKKALQTGIELLDGCGFYYESSVKFQDFLDKN